eukprot:5282355-Pleurochrysis_carterae.AAC.1
MARVEAARPQDDRDESRKAKPRAVLASSIEAETGLASLGGGGGGLASSTEAEAGLASLGRSGAGLA